MWDLALAQTQPSPSTPETFVSFIPLVIILVGWYFYSRYTRRRDEERLRRIISEELRKVVEELQTIGRTR